MRLVRNGVFETNSSSAHSLAYKNTVLRDYDYKPSKDLCLSIKELRLTKKPKEYEMYYTLDLMSMGGGMMCYALQQKN